ncbi:MAG: histidine phosphatase family protein [Acidimicrobiia bacterium]
MELVLVRHAEPEWSRDGLTISNPVLTERGHEQADLLAQRLAHEHFDAVYISPLVRSQQTAEPILKSRDLPIPETLDWLEEVKFPDWTGTPTSEVDERFKRAFARPVSEHWKGMPDGGEHFADFYARISHGVRSTLAPLGVTPIVDDPPLWEIDDESARVLIVAHAGTNAVITSHLLGIEPIPWEWERFVMFHASFSVIRPIRIGRGWSFTLYRLGDTEHVPDEMRTR